MKRLEVHEWVDKFWRNHNKRFFTEKDEFIAKHKQPGEDSVSADKMSEFYKAFLDKNWKMHVYFNISWYIKNFTLMFTALQVFLHNNIRKIRGK
jgi:apoptogenic protein 1